MNLKLNLSLLTKATLISVVVLCGLNLIGTNLLSTHGQDLESIKIKTLSLQKDNLYLRTQIAHNSSLPVVAQKAQSLGFTPISKTLSLSSPTSVALVAN